MKKSFKNTLTGIIIFAVTIILGFSISYIIFDLADTLSRIQLRILLSADIITLTAIGSACWFLYESRLAKKEKEAQFKKRHSKRVERINAQTNEAKNILSTVNFAA